MILGGGYYQLPLIKKSIDQGYFTIVCGINGNYPGYKYASKWYNVDTFDKEKCLQIAINEQIDGICVCGTDAVLPTLGYIVDNMNLKGPSYRSTTLSTNKALMKKAFVDNNVRTAKYCIVTCISQAIQFADENRYPIVLKVVDASGSKGVAIIRSQTELEEQYKSIITQTSLDYIIAEQFIDGIEFGAQAFVADGELTYILPHGDLVFQGDSGVPIGHYAPYTIGDSCIEDICAELKKCIKALEINNTAINADFILKDNEVYVLEIGARAGATCLPELVGEHFGLNYYEYLLKQCVGDCSNFTPTKHTPCIVETLLHTHSGRLRQFTLPVLPDSVVEFEFYPQIGDQINEFKTAYDRIGFFVLCNNSLENLYLDADRIKKNLVISLE